MQLGSETVKACYNCRSEDNLKEWSESDFICTKCYEEDAAILKKFRAERSFTYPEIDMIEQGIFLGNEDAANDEEIIMSNGITAICVCGNHLETRFDKDPRFKYLRFPIDDFPKQKVVHYFDEYYQWMQNMRNEGRKILVHCAAGVSRSATFMIAYFMRSKGMNSQQAKEFVKQRRNCINPNTGFRAELALYEQKLLGQTI